MKKLFCICLSVILLVINIASVYAEDINISIYENPQIDIVLTSRDTSFPSKQFEEDVLNKLEQKGLDTSLINIQTVESSELSVDSSNAKQIIDTWDTFPKNKASNWVYKSEGYITSTVNEPYETGFINTKEIAQNITLSGNVYANEPTQPLGYILRMSPQKENKNRYNLYMLWVSAWDGYQYTSQAPNATVASGRKQYALPQRSIILFKVEGLLIDYNLWKNVATSSTYSATPLCQTRYASKNVLGWPYHAPRSYGGFPDGTPLEVGRTVTNKGDSALKTTILGFKNVQIGSTYGSYDQNKIFNLKIEASGSEFKIYNDNALLFTAQDDSFTEGYYGLFHFSHVSPRFYGVSAQIENYKTFNDILLSPDWRQNADHYIVNIDKNEDEAFSSASRSEILSRTINDNITFIQWGSDNNKELMENFIQENNENGKFINYLQYTEALNETVEYIASRYTAQPSSETVLTNTPLSIQVSPQSVQSNTKSLEFPSGKWRINHDYKYFDNNKGQFAQSSLYFDALSENFTFDKPGKYDFYFGEELVKTILVHRKPVAQFNFTLDNNKINLVSTSYDEDSNIDTGFGKGIVEEKWSYKESDNQTFTEGKLENLESGKTYIIQLQVKDELGYLSDPVSKFISLENASLPPVALFNVNDIYINEPLHIEDLSFDPAGKRIKSYSYVLKKNGTVIGTYSTPLLDFKNLGTGEYQYTLTITNESNTVSSPYTKAFNVYEDTLSPEVVITPDSCNFIPSCEIKASFTDFGSGFSKFRYCITDTPSTPDNSLYSDYQFVDTLDLLLEEDGTHYLHIEALDVSGNLLTRIAGPYYIASPYTNKVIHNFPNLSFLTEHVIDFGKWHTPGELFKLNIEGFELKNIEINSEEKDITFRHPQPSVSIEYKFNYIPTTYNITYNYNLDCEEVDNPDTYTILDKVELNSPEKEGYIFNGWMLDGKIIRKINYDNTPTVNSVESFMSFIDNKQKGDIVLNASWTKRSVDNECMVYAEIGSDFKVKIPKTIVLSGNTKSATYNIEISGDIAGTESISVIPESSILLYTQNKAPIEASISQDKTNWAYDDLGLKAAGSLSAPALSAGKWSNKLNFTITFNSNGYKNSEESIEYHTLLFPDSFKK